jgi:hypothetical protein
MQRGLLRLVVPETFVVGFVVPGFIVLGLVMSLLCLSIPAAAREPWSRATVLLEPPADQPQARPADAPAQPLAAAPNGAAEGEAVLGGPKVPDELVRTLVRRDAKGNFQRAEGRPEEAALALLGLKPADREKARGVLGDRAALLCDFLLDRAEKLREAADLVASGKRDEATKMSRAFWDEFEPEHPHAPLLYAMGQALGASQEAELTRIVNEYWEAWISWELRNSKDKGDKARARVRERLALGLFQDEVRQAYERVVRPYRERVERLYSELDPTPEQRSAIRDAVVEFVRESRARPTREQRHEILTKIYTILDEERRVKFFDLIARQLVELQG